MTRDDGDARLRSDRLEHLAELHVDGAIDALDRVGQPVRVDLTVPRMRRVDPVPVVMADAVRRAEAREEDVPGLTLEQVAEERAVDADPRGSGRAAPRAPSGCRRRRRSRRPVLSSRRSTSSSSPGGDEARAVFVA